MNTEIGSFDKNTRTVSVKFTDGDFEFIRPVNVCLTSGGDYDDGATAERVAEVARGVEHKRSLGILATVLDNPADVPTEAAAV